MLMALLVMGASFMMSEAMRVYEGAFYQLLNYWG